MKQILFFALFGFAACGRLDNLYLPPNQRGYSGGLSSGQYSFQRGQLGGSSSGQYSGAAAGQYSGAAGGQYTGGAAGHYSAAQQVPILRLEDNNNGDGTYNYAYETGNGIAAQEQGDARGDGTRAQGGFSYTSPEGQSLQVQYTADENGYQPQGAHIPQIPEAIQRSIQQNLADEARGIVDDGQYRAGPSEQYGAQQGSGAQYTAPQYQGAQGFGAPQNQYIPPAFPGRRQGGYKY